MHCSSAIQKTAHTRAPGIRNVQMVDDDYEATSLDTQVQVVGNESDEEFVTITLPCDPLSGDEILIVAAAAPVFVDGGENAVVGNPNLPFPSATKYVFVEGDICECEEGQWIPQCCPPAIVEPEPIPIPG